MSMLPLKRNIRRLGHRLGLMTDWERHQAPPREQPASWYDEAYAVSQTNLYGQDYPDSCYYFLWSVITDRITRSGLTKVLDIGCGPGQFAQLLRDHGIKKYVGLDFSPVAIQLASQRVPDFAFVVGDARTSNVYEEAEHDVIVCTEVLEHVLDDLRIVSRFPQGKRCLCTVPNFPYESHVRHFQNAAEVRERYGECFDEVSVSTWKGPRSATEQFFLLDGIRNGNLPPAIEPR